jgi:threonylcarbamoyladenosine tRNA methylthiotransferase MtaB
MAEAVPMHERRARNARLRTLSEQKKRQFYHAHLDAQYNVLFERAQFTDTLEGFTDNYIKVKVPHNPLHINTIVLTQLTEEMLVLG